jgi:hypothetical protein
MTIHYLTALLFLISSLSLHAQSIVNTDKLFSNEEKKFSMASELTGNYISGNANVFMLNYSLNFALKHKRSRFMLLSGGEYINEDKQIVSNSIFGHLRFVHNVYKKGDFFSFYQIQRNDILLLNRRQLGGLGYRQNIFTVGTDSTNSLEFDASLGVMIEEEVLNASIIAPSDKSYFLLPRGIASFIFVVHISKGVTFVNTTYYQQNLMDINDFRILNESNLVFEVFDWLAFSFDLEVRFDSDPPSVLKSTDVNMNFGFLFSI